MTDPTNTECPRCGKNFLQWLEDNPGQGAIYRIDDNNQKVCDECFTDEEMDETFNTAHFLATGHYPDTPECNCIFDDEDD